MKKLLVLLMVILFVPSGVLAQDLIMENNPEEIFVFAGDSSLYQKETWAVELKPGENIYSWEKPFSVPAEEIFIRVEGGELMSVVDDASTKSTRINIRAKEPGKGKIHLTFPLTYLSINYLYQYFWESENNVPGGTLLVDITNESQESIPASHFIISGKEFVFDLKPYETKRLVVGELPVIQGEKILQYDPSYYGDSDVHFLWSLLIPQNLLFPAKAECFEGSTSGVVFLGESYISGESPKLEIEVGKSNDITVEEKIEKQEKLNQIYNRDGEEVLYDTREKKSYQIANRSPEKKKIEVFVPLQGSYELIAHSVPLNRVESNQISFVLELEPQQETEVILEVAGRHLTSGFAFRD